MIVKDLIKNSKKLVLDTGIYIEYFKTKEDKIKEYLRKTLFTDESEVKIYANYILKSEIYYVLCRALGKEKAGELLNEIELFLIFEESKNLYELAGQIKCKYSISLADCYSIATGIIQNCSN
ncbi:MAG: PIN domain-containing protein [Promethearchaeota archaeon]